MKRTVALILTTVMVCTMLSGCTKVCSICEKNLESGTHSIDGKNYCEECFADYIRAILSNNSTETESQPNSTESMPEGDLNLTSSETNSQTETSSEPLTSSTTTSS